jgi:LmbE family N-acetylglucosaminyl deacetylase
MSENDQVNSGMEEFLSRQRLLMISPHADDETAGAGGLIHRVKQAGGEAYVMVMSTGNLDHFDGKSDNVNATTRADELANAMNVLGVDDFEILWPEDDLHLQLDTLPRKELINHIERKARLCTENVQPTMIILPAPSFNQDHEAVYKAGITACRPHLASLKAFQRVVLIADAPQLSWAKEVFKPTFYVDISDSLEVKLEAYRQHKSQQRPAPHQGGVEALRFLAKMRGTEISVEAAEAYEVARFVI